MALAEGLDANWRGAFDLLVSPPHAAPALCGTAVGGRRVAPNYSASGAARTLTRADLDAVRKVAGVEVAAPIGMVGQVQGTTQQLVVAVPYDTKDRGYRLDAAIQYDDGVTNRTIAEAAAHLVMGTSPGEVLSVGGGTATDEGMLAGLLSFPPLTQTIVAVDPQAEMALLGEDGGFLSGLATLARDDQRTLSELGPAWQETVQRWDAVGTVPDPSTAVAVPVVVNDEPQFSLTASITATELDLTTVASPLFEEDPVSGSPMASTGLEAAWQDLPSTGFLAENSEAFDSAFLPLTQEPTTVAASWLPGMDTLGVVSQSVLTVQRSVPSEVRYEQRPGVDGKCAIRAVPVSDPVEFTWLLDSEWTADGPGPKGSVLLPVYRESTPAEQPADIAPLVVGRYSSTSVDSGVDLASYVPLGAYEVGSTWLLGEDPTAQVDDSRQLRASLDGLGLTAASPGAITDLQGGLDLIGHDPIDAIRVRVGGISGYDEQGRQRVATVAQQIQRLGLRVSVVAGSSREPTLIEVPSYPTADEPGPLGWVVQEWSTLGAARTVESSFDAVGRSLLWLALLTAGMASLAAATLTGVERRTEVAVLRRLGWRNSDLARWMWSEHAVGASLLAAALALSWWLAARSGQASAPLVGSVLAITAGVYVIGALLSWWTAVRRNRSDDEAAHGRTRPAATTPARMVGRMTVSAPLSTVLTVVGVIAAGAGAGAAHLAVLSARRDAGRTRLASLISETLLPLHLALVFVGIGGALLLLALSGHVQAQVRRVVTTVLASAGWTPRAIRGLWFGQVLVCVAGAVLPALVLSWAVTRFAGSSSAWPVATTLVGVVAAAATLLLSQWKVRHP
ncbi:hypothetical protein [Ornithinimicrobium avium]|uniref:hypothetical protein n=1 Tax=Ornithinimicrobium avium TaxID=2283195 RepID=UPI0013B43B57|nr:hypothetical protein [Ornithinimicrobium avium]